MLVLRFSKSSQFRKLRLFTVLVLTLEQFVSFFLFSFSDQNIHFDTITFFQDWRMFVVQAELFF